VSDDAQDGDESRRRLRWRRLIRAVALLVVAAFLWLVVCFVQVGRAAQRDGVRPVDAIVVMGAAQYDGTPSPQLQGRLDHAVELYIAGTATFVVVTGGRQPGDRFTEAEASRDYLIAEGVFAGAILLENAGSTTHESLEGAAKIFEAEGLTTALIVTDPYHALRAQSTAQSVGLDATVSPVPDGPNGLRRRIAEAGGVAIGRIIGFGRLAAITD
jgi:vancomycin permeability regulator SanA